MFRFSSVITALLLTFGSISCSQKSEQLTRIIVSGDANIQAQPDTAVLVISIVTQGQRALSAQQENAQKSDAVIRTVRALVGTNSQIKTSNYSLQPQQDYRDDRLPKIIGYEARNSITVTTSELDKVGAVIDAASQAGANSIEKVSFILRADNPAREQTLAEATRQAMNKAQSVAQALGGRVVRVVEEHEGSIANRPLNTSGEEAQVSYGVSPLLSGAAKTAAVTPLETGSLSVKTQVQLVVEIQAQQN